MAHQAPRTVAFIWGKKFSCQLAKLGLGNIDCIPKEPTKLIVDNITWAQIACGNQHTVALSSNGEVFTWGNNGIGQLGHGDEKLRYVPTKVESLSGQRIVKVACGNFYSAVIADGGKLLTW